MKTTLTPKIKATNQEERHQKWKEHLNMLENPPEIIDKAIEEIINDQLDIKLGYFMRDELCIVLRAIKNKSCRPQWNTSWSIEDKEI